MSGTYEPYPGRQEPSGAPTPAGYHPAAPDQPPRMPYQPTSYPPETPYGQPYRQVGYQQQAYPQSYPGQAMAAVPPAPMRARMTDQVNPSVTALIVAWVVTSVSGLYMLPWAIAVTRGKANKWSTFAVNLLLGWTIIGWIAALVMSLTEHRTVSYSYAVAPGWYPAPDGVGRAYWDGTGWTQVLR